MAASDSKLGLKSRLHYGSLEEVERNVKDQEMAEGEVSIAQV